MSNTEQDWDAYLLSLEKRLEKGEVMKGKDAALLLAYMYANATHGNYDGDILYGRTEPEGEYEITLQKKKVKG